MPLTCSTPVNNGGIAEGWLSVAFSALGLFGFFCIKCIFGGLLDRNLDHSRSEPFTNYYYVYAKAKDLKALTPNQLDEIAWIITHRE